MSDPKLKMMKNQMLTVTSSPWKTPMRTAAAASVNWTGDHKLGAVIFAVQVGFQLCFSNLIIILLKVSLGLNEINLSVI